MLMNMRMAAVAVMGWALLGTSLTSAATLRKFVKIADTTATFSDFLGVSINSSGTVAFKGTLQAGGEAIYTGSGGPLAHIASTGGTWNAVAGPSINDSGLVAFWVDFVGLGTGSGIYTGDGGSPNPVTAGLFVNVSGPDMNDAGEIAFESEEAVYKISGGTVTTIADTTGPFTNIHSNLPQINNAGQVAFGAWSSGSRGIYLGSGGGLTTIVETTAPSLFYSAFVAINDAGTVAYSTGPGVPEAAAVYTGTGAGQPQLVADTSGPHTHIGEGVDINSSGAVLFLTDFGYVVKTAQGVEPIVGMGTSLFGSTVSNFAMLAKMNDAGDVAFQYTLASGIRGIAVSRVIPEPGSAAILSAALGAIMIRRPCRTPRRTSG